VRPQLIIADFSDAFITLYALRQTLLLELPQWWVVSVGLGDFNGDAVR
jgi:hypothetical protein